MHSSPVVIEHRRAPQGAVALVDEHIGLCLTLANGNWAAVFARACRMDNSKVCGVGRRVFFAVDEIQSLCDKCMLYWKSRGAVPEPFFSCRSCLSCCCGCTQCRLRAEMAGRLRLCRVHEWRGALTRRLAAHACSNVHNVCRVPALQRALLLLQRLQEQVIVLGGVSLQLLSAGLHQVPLPCVPGQDAARGLVPHMSARSLSGGMCCARGPRARAGWPSRAWQRR